MKSNALVRSGYLALYLPILCACLTLLAAGTRAQDITATPGTFELVEGGSMYFDGRPQESAPDVQRYQWQIFSGEGGQLVGADQARVQFIAPRIDEDTRSFTLQLTMHYASGKQAAAQTRIRVHRKRDRVVYRDSPWQAGIGFGFGYYWGAWWRYPPVIIIPCPPPGGIILPEDLEPIAVPLPEDPGFTEWAAEHPDWDDIHENRDPLPDAMLDMAEPWDAIEDPQSEILTPLIEPTVEDAMESDSGMMPEPIDDYDDPGMMPEPIDDYDDGGWNGGMGGDMGGGMDGGGFDDF